MNDTNAAPTQDQLLQFKQANDAIQVPPPAAQGNSVATTNFTTQAWTPAFALSIGLSVLVFGLIITLMMSLLVAKGKQTAEDTQRLFALPLIVIAAVFLVVIGYTQDQIAPVVGLLGTIAGYLLGSQKNKGPGNTDPTTPTPVPAPQPPPAPAP